MITDLKLIKENENAFKIIANRLYIPKRNAYKAIEQLNYIINNVEQLSTIPSYFQPNWDELQMICQRNIIPAIKSFRSRTNMKLSTSAHLGNYYKYLYNKNIKIITKINITKRN